MMLELIDGLNQPDETFQERLTTKYSCQTPLCISVPDSMSVCDKKEVEETRTFTMNPEERPCFCPFIKPVTSSEP